MEKMLTLASPDPDVQLKFLQQSHLSTLIKDEELLNRMYQAALNLLTSDKLRACDPYSILGALYKVATMKFRLELEFGECYLIPRKVKGVDVCQFQIGYKGWKAMALESVPFIEAREVYVEDRFDFEYGTKGFLTHRPADQTKGITTHFYARTLLKNGVELFEVINKQAAEKSRRHSESQYDWTGGAKKFSETPKDIWAKHYAAMAMRVPIKKLCAMLPLSPNMEKAMQADNTVSYVDKNGVVTTMSEVQVEKDAVDLSSKAPAEMDEKLKDKYDEIGDSIANMNFEEFMKFFTEQFMESDLKDNMVFVELMVHAAADKATTVAHLTNFYDACTWKNHAGLMKILTSKRKEIETNAKRN
jgi:recombination protein RecT